MVNIRMLTCGTMRKIWQPLLLTVYELNGTGQYVPKMQLQERALRKIQDSKFGLTDLERETLQNPSCFWKCVRWFGRQKCLPLFMHTCITTEDCFQNNINELMDHGESLVSSWVTDCTRVSDCEASRKGLQCISAVLFFWGQETCEQFQPLNFSQIHLNVDIKHNFETCTQNNRAAVRDIANATIGVCRNLKNKKLPVREKQVLKRSREILSEHSIEKVDKDHSTRLLKRRSVISPVTLEKPLCRLNLFL